MKRFVADWDLSSDDPYRPVQKADRGKKIAIIGAGPGGLTAAFYLRCEGYKPAVFEKTEYPGGMLRWGIPEYRLPKKILDAEVELITRLGVAIHYNHELGRDFTLTTLKEQGYEAILLAIGAQGGMPMQVSGETLPGVVIGVDFLHQVAAGKIETIGRRVVVVGGGNTAMDAARTALRLKAKEVTILYRRTRDEMPANAIEIDEAMEEGIHFEYLAAPIALLGDQRVEKIRCIRMQLGEPDKSGRRRPVPIAGSEFELAVDNIIAAIGQNVDLECLKDETLLPEISRWNTFVVDESTMATTIPGIFAVGDAVTGPQAAIDAIAGGGRAAKAIHHWLETGQMPQTRKEFIVKKEDFRSQTREDFIEYKPTPRPIMPTLKPDQRIKNFKEIELGYSEKKAVEEAKRCMECGCKDLFECRLKYYAEEYSANGTLFAGSFKQLDPDDSHPFIRVEPNKCINCGRCVRICAEVQNIFAWGFVKRGFDAVIQPTFQDPLVKTKCESCGQCIQSCPTGALTEKNPHRMKPGPFCETTLSSLCLNCSTGCETVIHQNAGQVERITGKENDLDCQNLCFRGRFGYFSIPANKFLNQPLRKTSSGLLETISSDQAWQELKHRLNNSQNPLIVCGEFLPMEAFQELQNAGFPLFSFNQPNYQTSIQTLVEFNLKDYSGCSCDHWNEADTFIIINNGYEEENPVFMLELLRLSGQGKQVIHIGKKADSKLQPYLHKQIVALSENPEILFTELLISAQEVSADIMEKSGSETSLKRLRNLLALSRKMIIISNLQFEVTNRKVSEFIAKTIKSPDKCRLLLMGGHSNTWGWIYHHGFKLPQIDLQQIPDLVIFLGQDPYVTDKKRATASGVENWIKKIPLKIVIDRVHSPISQEAELLIPLTNTPQADGTYLNYRHEGQTICPEKRTDGVFTILDTVRKLIGCHATESIESRYFNSETLNTLINRNRHQVTINSSKDILIDNKPPYQSDCYLQLMRQP